MAVLTYLRRILEALDHPDMIHLILHYLLALPDSKSAATGSRTSVSAARKRKSMDLATIMAAQQEASATPALFNLVDLIHGCLKSENQQTVSVTLQLVSAILRRHHRYAVTTLLSTSHVVSETPLRTVGGHEKEMDFLLTLAGNVGTEDDFDTIYDDHLKDCMSILESHACSLSLVAPKTVGSSIIPATQATIAGAPRDIRAHTLRPEDPLLKTLLVILTTFFTNSVETNLSLTGTIVDLATCGFMRLDGWLLPDASTYKFNVEALDSEDEDDVEGLDKTVIDPIEALEKSQLRSLRNNRRIPTWSDAKTPAILLTLQDLVEQISAYREEIPRFDDLLQRRREAFQATSHIDTTAPLTVHQPPPRSSIDTPASRSPSPLAKPSALDSLAQRIFDKIDSPARSRAGSPRGRQRGCGGPSSPLVVPRSSGAPPQFPMGAEGRGSPSPLRQIGEDRERSRGLDAQMRAFEGIERGILGRRVGIPAVKSRIDGAAEVEAIPFKLKEQNTHDDEHGDDQDATSPIQEDEIEDAADGDAQEESDRDQEVKQASVSHVLTNVLVLQDFLLELAALVQVRAGLFGEIRFV